MLQDVVQHAGAEGVSRSGGLDDSAQLAGRFKDPIPAVVGVASVPARGHVQEADVRIPLLQRRSGPVKVLFAGHKQDFVVRDFQDVALTESPGDLLLRRFFVRPEGRAPVRIKGDHRPGLAGQLQRSDRGAAAGFIRQGQRAEVEDPAGLQQLFVQFIRPEQQVRPRLPIEAEVPVAVWEGVDNRQGRRNLRVAFQAAGVNTGLLHRFREKISKSVLPHLADESGLFSKLLQHGQDICRGSAGVCLKQRISLAALPVPGKVDQQFSQRHNIIFLHRRFRPLYDPYFPFSSSKSQSSHRKPPGRSVRFHLSTACPVSRSRYSPSSSIETRRSPSAKLKRASSFSP